MSDNSERFITQMKLRELRKQRDQLQKAYSQLEQAVAVSPDAETKFRVLYEGLQTLRFAHQSLHPQVRSLDVLLQELKGKTVSSDLLLFWLKRLESELAVGKMRTEFVYLFGLLLQEWVTQEKAAAPPSSDRENATQAIHEQLTTAMTPPDYVVFLSPLIQDLGKIGEGYTPGGIGIEAELFSPIDEGEVETILSHIRDDIYRPSAVRGEARWFLDNAAMQHELTDALTILLNDIDDWTWPSSGVSAEVILARRKWRLFLAEDLPTACFLEILGMRWNTLLKRLNSDERANRLNRLERLLELGAPDVIVRNERRMINEAWGMTPTYPVDIWSEQSIPPEKPDAHSIVSQRIKIYQTLRDITLLDRYSGQQSTSSMETALMLINAEIQLARTAFPDQPLHILKIDLKDFYASISHAVLFTILTELGLSEKHRSFFERFLQVPIQLDEQVITTQHGIPNDRILSNWLAELLLRLLDRHIEKSVPVQIIRLVDDLCILSPSSENILRAWEAAKTFCHECGLAINEDKSGSVCIGGERLAQLPSTLPHWLMLTLTSEGQWQVNTADLNSYLDRVRQRINDAPSILAQVEIYNNELDYLKDELATGAALGKSHRDAIHETLMRFHHDLFGEGRGIAEKITEALLNRLVPDVLPYPIPDSWLYWPVTAGGLGLKHAAIIVTSYEKSLTEWTPTPPTQREADWQYRHNEWVSFFSAYLNSVTPAGPWQIAEMEARVKDFIERGATLTSGKQKTLSPYWRWVLYTYGPQILDRFGTFRFLTTELVPLQLISQRRVGDKTSGEDDVITF